MEKKSLTKDEVYLIKLAKTAEEQTGDRFAECDRYAIGKALGYNPKSVDNIVRMLAQTNFIKKGEGDRVYLTRNGETLLRNLEE